MWLFHLPQWQKSSAISQPHGKQHLPITPSGSQTISDNNICHNQHPKKLAITYAINITYGKYANIWQKKFQQKSVL